MEREAYTDVDYSSSTIDRRSTFKYCTCLGQNLVTSRSKKQLVVATLRAEALVQTMAHGVRELLWLKIILEELKITREAIKKFYCESNSAITITRNPVQQERTKHMEVTFHKKEA